MPAGSPEPAPSPAAGRLLRRPRTQAPSPSVHPRMPAPRRPRTVLPQPTTEPPHPRRRAATRPSRAGRGTWRGGSRRRRRWAASPASSRKLPRGPRRRATPFSTILPRAPPDGASPTRVHASCAEIPATATNVDAPHSRPGRRRGRSITVAIQARGNSGRIHRSHGPRAHSATRPTTSPTGPTGARTPGESQATAAPNEDTGVVSIVTVTATK
jgi:hypothetical protein